MLGLGLGIGLELGLCRVRVRTRVRVSVRARFSLVFGLYGLILSDQRPTDLTLMTAASLKKHPFALFVVLVVSVFFRIDPFISLLSDWFKDWLKQDWLKQDWLKQDWLKQDKTWDP